MDIKDINNVLKFHNLCCKLKNLKRTGWVYWHVSAERVESVAEHIFGVCALATAILSNLKNHNLDENKILAMCALHEMEEVFIGDISDLDDNLRVTKKERGQKAVEELFADLINPQHFTNLIAEFEEQKTPESKFARACDKLEADLQAYMYEGSIDYENAEKHIVNHKIVLDSIKNGGTCLGDHFVFSNLHRYDEMFTQIALQAKNFYKKS